MTLGYISDAYISAWLETLRTSARYASLHFAMPSWSDPGASEVVSAGYLRQLLYWTPESARGLTTAQQLVFQSVPTMEVYAVGLWTAAVGGSMVAYAAAPATDRIIVESLSTLTLPAGEVSLRLL